MEEKISFAAGDIYLEGRLADDSGDRAVVITHPHPQYGGDMHNAVVEAISQAYRRQHIAVMTFNFRGVGQSQGAYSHGTGEQRDVAGAFAYLAKRGKHILDLAGYSFGAWVNILAAQRADTQDQLNHLILVSPPVVMIDSLPEMLLPRLKLVVTGSRDDIAPAAKLARLIGQQHSHSCLKVIDGADHFYFGHFDALKSAIAGSIV
jgi:alpha/beta superfamily hydrolase